MPSTQSRLLPFSGKTWLTYLYIYRYIETTLFQKQYIVWCNIFIHSTKKERKENRLNKYLSKGTHVFPVTMFSTMSTSSTITLLYFFYTLKFSSLPFFPQIIQFFQRFFLISCSESTLAPDNTYFLYRDRFKGFTKPK